MLDGLRDTPSRPMTPGGAGLEKDERDDFLRRENELNDQLAEKVRLSPPAASETPLTHLLLT